MSIFNYMRAKKHTWISLRKLVETFVEKPDEQVAEEERTPRLELVSFEENPYIQGKRNCRQERF